MYVLWSEEHTELGFQDLFQVFGFRTLFPFDALFPRQIDPKRPTSIKAGSLQSCDKRGNMR